MNIPLTAAEVAAVIGASGGIGSAFVAHLARDAGIGLRPEDSGGVFACDGARLPA